MSLQAALTSHSVAACAANSARVATHSLHAGPGSALHARGCRIKPIVAVASVWCALQAKCKNGPGSFSAQARRQRRRHARRASCRVRQRVCGVAKPCARCPHDGAHGGTRTCARRSHLRRVPLHIRCDRRVGHGALRDARGARGDAQPVGARESCVAGVVRVAQHRPVRWPMALTPDI